MTSMPASRSARAMIFAPRSCPSRPGLATTTLILPAIPRVYWPPLEDGCLAPNAPDLAERIAQLAHRHIGAGGIDDWPHQVAVFASGVLLQPRERRLDRR